MSDQMWNIPEEELTGERYLLMTDRISRIASDDLVPEKYRDYFKKGAVFLLKTAEIYEKKRDGSLAQRSVEECQADQEMLYAHISPAHYAESYANPEYAVSVLGKEAGQMLTLLCSETEGCIAYAFQGRQMELTLLFELFVQVYNCLEEDDLREARDTIYWFFHDYSEIFVENSIHDMICPENNFFADIVMTADLSDLRYLYQYGLPVSENDLAVARFLNTLPEEEIQAMADTYTEGYRIGFENAGIDLSKKKAAELDSLRVLSVFTAD
ncbi:MAG: leucyl aminopeptidase, partial [Clostridiales bacterium]|nr:leucyl aminopeptidase [Clostridiales bacterium]